MLDVRRWTWTQWMLFGFGCLFLATYFGFISLGVLEELLDHLAGPSERTAGMFTPGLERAEALFLMFAFLLLTPLAAFFGLLLPLFLSAVTSTFLSRTAQVPDAAGALLFWIAAAVAAWLTLDQWWPHATWFVALLARAFLVALRGTV